MRHRLSLIERIDATDWAEEDIRFLERLIGSARCDQRSHDLLMVACAHLIGGDDAELLTLRRRGREIVDLTLAVQAERARPAERRLQAGRVRLAVVGGRDMERCDV